MSKKINKQEIFDACVQKQEKLIANFEARRSEMKDDTTRQSESASQTEDRTAGKIELMVTMEKELAFAQMEMGYLKAINPEQDNIIVEPGAVVVTGQRTFFIAISSEKIEVNGETIFGLSTGAPIYSVMEGLKKGEKFSFNQTNYIIQDLY